MALNTACVEEIEQLCDEALRWLRLPCWPCFY